MVARGTRLGAQAGGGVRGEGGAAAGRDGVAVLGGDPLPGGLVDLDLAQDAQVVLPGGTVRPADEGEAVEAGVGGGAGAGLQAGQEGQGTGGVLGAVAPGDRGGRWRCRSA
ncbi:hypothetical protein GCM10018987_60550 [Streptomyces cremeus]